MTLNIDRTTEGYIRVIDTSISFTDTNVNIILYDMNKALKKVNNNDWCKMDERTRDWVKKYYIPKVI